MTVTTTNLSRNQILSRTLRTGTPAETKRAHETLCTGNNTGFVSGKARTMSVDINSKDFHKTFVKPKLIESKVSSSESFFRLTDGFQRVFSNDRQDRSMVVPVVGYGGHRRGDRSQNFFGKSFRDTTIQSKYLEREFRNTRQQDA